LGFLPANKKRRPISLEAQLIPIIEVISILSQDFGKRQLVW
jgi:hypothetical protein